MNRTKRFLALLLCIILFAAAVLGSLFFTRGSEGDEDTANPIVMSEILASNRTYPNASGQYLDYVEIHNTTGSPMDISGYMLADNSDSIGYTFPNGTILQAHSYIVCWCNKDSDSEDYASFGISRNGEETIYLYNSANVLIDQFQVPRVNDNVPLIRQADDSWTTATYATPGYENTEEGFNQWLHAMGADDISVVISEVMPGSGYAVIDGEGNQSDWIELLNTGSEAVTLDDGFLSDDPEDRTKYMIPSLTIEPGQRVVIRCAGDYAREGEADFALSRDGCTVILTGALGNTIAMVECPDLGKECSWVLQEDGTYLETTQTTPGYENTEAGYEAWLQDLNYTTPEVVISEIMTANRSTITNKDGELCDWIELYNPTGEAISLEGLYLSNDAADRMKWPIPAMILAAGQRTVICCSGSGAPEGEAEFALSRAGCTVLLSGSVGNVIAQVDVPRMAEDRSWALQSNGTYVESDIPSPGFENTEDGCLNFRATLTITSPLIISEVMPSNCTYLMQHDAEYYDWLELANVSEDSIRLCNYALSDDPEELHKFILPDVTLAPGERIVIILSGYTNLTTDAYTHAPFTLSREESWVYLSRVSESGCADYLRIYDVPYQHSVGRVEGDNGTYYFTKPTPGTTNGSGVAFISETPVVVTEDGVYNDVTSVSVELNGEGPLYYTLDGSIPNANSSRYSGPISLTATSVIRVVSIEDGKLPSDVVTASYIINENHTLPVISVAAKPDDLFGGAGIYVQYRQEKEVLCNVTLYENGEGFTIDCGLEMFGHTGLKNPKKSFKINFRGRYGSNYLTYPVYGEDGPQVYESLLIRSGQDYPKSIFRDELFTSLCREATDNVLAQRDKFCILYINGEYFGIYCLKEAFSETFYAQNKSVSVGSVEVVQAPFGTDAELYTLYKYCLNNNLRNDEPYEYVTSQIDIDSLIDWMIFEAYCTNGDVQQNLRYFRSTETGNKWQMAYYDLDWAFYYNNGFKHVLSPDKAWQHLGFTRGLAKNPQFREKLLQRCSEFYYGTLSDENVIKRIDYYYELLKPEVERERDRWTSSYEAWEREVQNLKNFVTKQDHWGNLINSLKLYVNLTDAEEAQYFGR